MVKVKRTPSRSLNGLRFLQPIPWPEVNRLWQRQERRSGWAKHYRGQGYRSWQEWRNAGFRPFRPHRRAWSLYEVSQPLQTIPRWYGGPFRGWKGIHYRGRSTASFAELAIRPKILRHPKVRGLLRQFPKNSLMIGAMIGRRLYILEGMHRACALALAAQQGRPVRARITIALTRLRQPLPDLSHPSKKPRSSLDPVEVPSKKG